MECKSCGCEPTGKPVQYRCDCKDGCECSVIEFDAEPNQVPYCCGQPMKKVE